MSQGGLSSEHRGDIHLSRSYERFGSVPPHKCPPWLRGTQGGSSSETHDHP
jgi:hypothetical protein